MSKKVEKKPSTTNSRADIYVNKEKQTTSAVLKDTAFDAVEAIARRMGVEIDGCTCGCIYGVEMDLSDIALDKAVMHDRYSATVKVHGDDVFNEDEGEKRAVKKAMDNHKDAFTRALTRWQVAMLKKIKSVSPETFDKALEKANK